MKDKTRGDEDNSYTSLEEAKEAVETRKIGEVERYKKRYGVDLEEEQNYQLIIDTSYAKTDDIADVILQCLRYEQNGNYYGKTWTSPKKMLPTQRIQDTCLKGSCFTLKEMIQEIRENGYLPSKELQVAKLGEKLFVYEGHHRNFASAILRRTMVPYYISNENDKASQDLYNYLTPSMLYDYEGAFPKDPKTQKPFRYEEVYSGIYQELMKKEGQER